MKPPLPRPVAVAVGFSTKVNFKTRTMRKAAEIRLFRAGGCSSALALAFGEDIQELRGTLLLFSP
jgi:hypothetical protein